MSIMNNLFGEEYHQQIERELINEHRKVFGAYFESEHELDKFINKNLEDSKNNIQRRTINNVQRLVTLADELSTVKPGKWDLAIFFLLSCIESIYSLNGSDFKKQEMVIDFFEKYISSRDQDLIQGAITITEKGVTYDYRITMERFALLLVAIRNLVAHEGIYWNMQFIHEEAEERVPLMLHFQAKPHKNSPHQKTLFTNTMKFSELRDMFLRGCIRFINQHESVNALI